VTDPASATLVVDRPRSGFADRGRKYKVVVDDDVVGTVRSGESREFVVAHGDHRVFVAFTWTNRLRSNDLTVSLAPGGVAKLSCAFKRRKGWGWPLDRSPRIALSRPEAS